MRDRKELDIKPKGEKERMRNEGNQEVEVITVHSHEGRYDTETRALAVDCMQPDGAGMIGYGTNTVYYNNTASASPVASRWEMHTRRKLWSTSSVPYISEVYNVVYTLYEVD